MAIANLQTTAMRERMVDFSKPFMSAGITMIGIKKNIIIITSIVYEENGKELCL